MDRIIFHIDVNSAYLSWSALEKLHNGSDLDLRTIPAIIGGQTARRCSGKIHPGQGLRDRDGRAHRQCHAQMSGTDAGAAGS